MKKKKLKLFVWTDYNSDYISGLAFALAYDEKHAKKLILKKIGYGTVEDIQFNGEPEILNLKPIAFEQSGGSG